MSCNIKFSHDPSHLENFGSMPVLNVARLPRPGRESSPDVSPDELENPYEDESSKLSFESLFCSHELQLHPPARRYLT